MKIYPFLILIVLISFSVQSDKRISDQEYDVQVLISLLNKKEGKIDANIGQNAVELLFQDLQKKSNSRMSRVEFFKLLSSTVSKLQNGHTQLHPSVPIYREWARQRKSLPFDYILVGKKLFLQPLHEKDEKHFPDSLYQVPIKSLPEHAEIYKIDGLTVDQMINKIGLYLSSDENSSAFKRYQAAQLFEFYRGISFETDKDSLEITYIKKRDTLTTYYKLGLPPIYSMNERLKEQAKKETKRLKDTGKFHIVKGKYAYFRFESFYKCKGKKYNEFLKKSFEEIRDKKIHKLIVDLRGNTGGIMQVDLMRYFTGANVKIGKYIVDKPFRKFENKHIKKWDKDFKNHYVLSLVQKYQMKRNPKFDGSRYTEQIDQTLIYHEKIIVITDEGTFSAASTLASWLKTMCHAKIAGCEAGGSFYKGSAGTLKVELPKSKMKLVVNPNYYQNTEKLVDDPLAIKQPDFPHEEKYPFNKKHEEDFINHITRDFNKINQ